MLFHRRHVFNSVFVSSLQDILESIVPQISMSVIQVLVNMVATVRMVLTSIIARVLSGTMAQTVKWTW